MFSSLRRPLAVLCVVIAMMCATAAFAQESQGVVTSFAGTLSNEAQEDQIAFTVDASQYTFSNKGRVGLVFLMSSEDDSLDPGLISIDAEGSASVKSGLRKPDTAGSRASIALGELSAGTFQITVRSQHKTKGDYRVDVLLAGDANRDYRVDVEDVQIISELSGTKHGDATYSPYADVDRNGVTNGGDRQAAESNVGAIAPAPTDELNPLEQSLPMGALALVDGSPETFVSRSGLRFSLTGAKFDARTEDVTLTVNGTRVAASALAITDHLFTANIQLANGRNDISLKAYDTEGRPLYYNETLWAGSSPLTVRLVNANGSLFLQPSTVVVTLSDDTSVSVEQTTSTGIITFPNMPSRTVLIKAKGPANEMGTAGVVGSAGTVTIPMKGYDTPSNVQNNDFSLGTAGWNVGTAPVAIVPHQEVIFGAASRQPAVSASAVMPTALVDQDLMLGTSGIGLQSISRTFTTAPDTTGIKVRYRFITSEVPGGYYGSQFNDYFRVSIRTQNGGGFSGETTAMNSLPLSAFTAGGSTDWREATLLLDTAGDTIQVDIGVANVGDGALQSQVVVDFVEEITDEVRPELSWNNTQGGLTLRWRVLNRALTNPVTINVHFANGTGYANRLGAAVFTHTVPAGTQPGPGGPVRVAGNLLQDDPDGTTHMIAVASESQVGSVRDVRVAYGANANRNVVSAGMIDIVKDGLRAAGASVGNITSTLRSQEDQARAMFDNLVNPARTIEQNVQRQNAIYGAGGEAVIARFVTETAGMTRAQIVANAAAIQAAMVDEMNDIAPRRVSNHIGDPAVRTVIDVGYSSFTGGNGGLFVTSVRPRVTLFLNEPENSCYHLELLN